ncbi:TonB-dependent receptor [Spongiibacter sp. KMU-158]|uniref:TonB-dependent receptor n=1 Tax=Spongiibacter pelagi TaxID=2760804 RepID=A0A927C085_9GAMM|nr:TonB-dependent receptor [Spongiibacter pelagi]MBD2858324.1 TonB-dependent receptor [Spongiibacter pelagi]
MCRPPFFSFAAFCLSLLFALAVQAETELTERKVLPSHTEQGLAIEEVRVTVSKRSESLQDVLGSVSAVSGDTIASNNIQDFRSLADLIPGMVVQRQEPGGDEVSIRGIARSRDGPSPVAFHINDMFLAMRGEPYYDLSAIEVLRGPSGTAFGRNATAGAINVKWRKPEAEFGAGGDLRYSSLEDKQIRAFANIPLLGEGNSGLLARFAVMARKMDGSLNNLDAPPEEDPGNVDEHFLRAYFTSEPVDNLNLGLRIIRYENNPHGNDLVLTPSLATRRSGTLEELGAKPLPDDLLQVRASAAQYLGESYDHFTRIDGDLTWSFNAVPLLGDFDAVFLAGEQRRKVHTVYDLDGTEQPILDGHNYMEPDIRRSAELRFVSNNDNGFDWLLGAFWFRYLEQRDMEIFVREFISPASVVSQLPAFPETMANIRVFIDDQRTIDESRALFANLNMSLAQLFDGPNIELSLGLRQNWDDFDQNVGGNDIEATIPALAVGPVSLVSERDIEKFADFVETTGELGARWFYSDAGMLYLKFSRGYKPGLAQNVVVDNTVIQNPVDAELLDAWEAGWKTAFLQNSLQLSLAAFFYDYQNLQVSQITPGGVLTENAAEATINGLELELQWTPMEALSIRSSFAWTDATYDEYCGTDPARENTGAEAGCTAENPFDFSGAQLTAAPEYSATLLANYRFDLGELGSLTPQLKVAWRDEMDRRGLGNPIDRVKAFSNTDIRLIWQSQDARWKLEGFVENLEDHDDVFGSAFAPIVPSRKQTYSMTAQVPPRVSGLLLELQL